jgi:CheY-like chemotaxis protein
MANSRGDAMMKGAMEKLVLVVEDQPDERAYLKAFLADNGYGVVTAEDGDEAMAVVRRDHPDLVTLDITMPKKSGVRFYRELKGDPDLESTPVVVVTAVTGFGGDPSGFKKFISAREQVPAPEGFVSKPVDQAELLTVVAGLLGECHGGET